ncbi:MFS general substrate transporter [Venustampulla echinocandica]|uniref:MFS general substrate transporter n=1 Tax=Venustampulla echinocandica TaxID=2656787 RepID=A0A370TQ92_9HELO|nr:MFS general substrate transporter [Venustampulla echinocandica]RDL37694.1 MFS general substrate transporter [Venustampulla echinocandica]
MPSINFLNRRAEWVFIATTTTFALSTLFVAGRLISRFFILRHRTADDWWMILAWFLAFGLSFSIDYSTTKGLGRHDNNISTSDALSLRRCEYAFTILYNPALMATKTSILVLYLRLSKNSQRVLRYASYATLGVVNVAGVVLTFMNAFQCRPVTAAYKPSESAQECISIVTLYLCSAPVNIITDLAILALPIPVLTGMRLPQRQKTILVLTFALGIFVTIVDVLRIYYLQDAISSQVKGTGRLGTSPNFAWNVSTALVWSTVEVNVGIICGCVPTLKPLIKRILPAMITSKYGTSKSGSMSSQRHNELHQGASIPEPESGIQPPSRAQIPSRQEAEMAMMDFLTVPETMPDITRPRSPYEQEPQNAVYFGFVNMQVPKSMLKTKGMDSFKYCATVTILFFLWGFSYGLLNTLNSEISKIADHTTSQTLGLSTAYFGAYFFGAMTVGQWTLRHGGFKATFISGLCIYGTGTLMFWPSAVLTSFPGFLISNIVVGFGLSVLETAANPFLALCGPIQYAELRLLLAQGVQAIATILSQLLAERALFSSIYSSPSLIDVQWTYLAITLFTVALALFFYYMPLPEADDAELQMQADDLGIYSSETFFGTCLRLIYMTLGLAIFAQFCYVAAQECMSVWFTEMLTEISPASSLAVLPNNYVLIGHTTFALGRLFFVPLCLLVPPRILLLVAFIGCLVCSSLTMALDVSANRIAVPSLLFFFFEGPIWPLIFAIGLRGLGGKTKFGAGCLTAAASGGGIFPFVMYAVQQIQNKSIQYSYCVIIALFAFGMLLPLYLNFVPNARAQVDPYKGAPGTRTRKLSRPFHILSKQVSSATKTFWLQTSKAEG